MSCPILSSLVLLWHVISCPLLSCHCVSVCERVYCTVYTVSICTLFNRVHQKCNHIFTNHTRLAREGDDFHEMKINMAVIIYAKRLISSATVLCVPGMGYDTYRVFETLLAGWAAVFCFLFKSWLCLHCGLLFELSILLLCVFVCSYWWLTLLRLLMMILSSGMPVFERAVGLDRSYHRLPVLLLDDFAQLTPQLLRQVRRVWCV